MSFIRDVRLRALIVVAITVGCGQAVLIPSLVPASAIPRAPSRGDVLKVHLRDGGLYMLNAWAVNDAAHRLDGEGSYFDVRRSETAAPVARIPLDSIALVETNQAEETFSVGMQGLGALAILGGTLSVACLADPKSCFGSCPTFYLEGSDSSSVRAEGFSASVAKVLEAKDVDALGVVEQGTGEFALHMKNEAWETHMVRRLSLLAVPVGAGERAFASGDSLFYRAAELVSPRGCVAPEGDCLVALAKKDGVERASRADSLDLAQRELIDLVFDDSPATAGLVLTARNSLVTTYLFYQTLAYTGSRYADMLAAMERGTREQALSQFGMAQRLGNIEVQVLGDSNAWHTVGSFGEPGPIASDTKVIPLPAQRNAGPLHLRLRMAKGSWRIDHAALTELRGAVQPVRVLPTVVLSHGRADTLALHTLRGESGDQHLVSMPGSDFRVAFTLPSSRVELYLESEGYYYEWMRREWMSEENIALATITIADPTRSLRRLAPAYYSRELMMDSLFFKSRFNDGGARAAR